MIRAERLVTDRTGGATLSEDDSREVNTNSGATSTDITLTLPTAATGLSYTFVTVDSGTITVGVPTGAAISYSGGTMGNGEDLHVQGSGSSVTLVCTGTTWMSVAEVGSLVEETP